MWLKHSSSLSRIPTSCHVIFICNHNCDFCGCREFTYLSGFRISIGFSVKTYAHTITLIWNWYFFPTKRFPGINRRGGSTRTWKGYIRTIYLFKNGFRHISREWTVTVSPFSFFIGIQLLSENGLNLFENVLCYRNVVTFKEVLNSIFIDVTSSSSFMFFVKSSAGTFSNTRWATLWKSPILKKSNKTYEISQIHYDKYYQCLII